MNNDGVGQDVTTSPALIKKSLVTIFRNLNLAVKGVEKKLLVPKNYLIC